MFGRKSAVVKTVVEGSAENFLVPVGREITTVPMDDNERAVYEKICGSIGFEPADLLYTRILAFFKEKRIRVFDYGEVSAYMKQKAEKEDKVWFWRPLRPADVIAGWRWDNGVNPVSGAFNHDYYNPVRWECRPYAKAVPLRVLARVEQIHRQFGDRVKFLVTDYAVPQPDPFIAVEALDMPRTIFDYWDEPNFGVQPSSGA